jgi:hypothetical protein
LNLSRRSSRAFVLGAALFAAWLADAASLAASGPQAPSPPPAPTVAPPSGTQPGASTSGADPTALLVLSGSAAVLIHPIKSDKSAEFEDVLRRFTDALQRSTDPTRQRQAAGLKIAKADEPGPAGAVLYLFVVDPVVEGADYTMSRVLAEAYPNEVAELWGKLRDAYAGPIHRLTLRTVGGEASAR